MTRQTAHLISRALAQHSPTLRSMIADMPTRSLQYWLTHAARWWIFAGNPEIRLPCV